MTQEIITLLGLSDYPFLSVWISCIVFAFILASAFSVIKTILDWVGGKR